MKSYEYFHSKSGLVNKILYVLYSKLHLRTTDHVCEYLRGGGAVIGKNVYLSTPDIVGSEPFLVSIGDNTYFSGSDIQLITHDGCIMQLSYMGLTDKKYDYLGKIKIGKNCFIGARSMILKNVELGDNCIVGAGAVVTKSFPNNSVVGGVPARFICTVDEFYAKNQKHFSDTFGMSFKDKRDWCEKNLILKK